jgi:AcrR family transcriptional regulator
MRQNGAMTDDAPTRILDAVERLCVEKAPWEVSMRAIAAEAGVSLGLAHHHFGSRDELFGRALDRIATDVTLGTDPGDRPADVLREIWARLRKRPAFARLIVTLILEDMDVSAVMSGHPLIERTVTRAVEAGDPDPQGGAATLAVLALSGAFFGPPINRVIGRDPDDPALFDGLTRLIESESGTP